ncbi:EG45-like domain containing protein [Chenopodium quinoa]|uniref:EG45-like domain containing protein n=1 Tax=Chenopodium quinoa TaxID=63459 RepID=UPI000B77D6AD|nr:EG45-like domain containing protein [Chenopodium quinoa]
MASLTRAMMLMAIFASFASVAYCIAGTATYYTVYKPSSCYGNEDQGTMIAAVSSDIFQNKQACGHMYRVTCTGANCRGGSVTVKVVDLCPGCSANGFDLSQEAFSAIADINAGRISIDYTPA